MPCLAGTAISNESSPENEIRKTLASYFPSLPSFYRSRDMAHNVLPGCTVITFILAGEAISFI